MVTLITTVLGVIFKVVQLGAKIALNRTTVILTFVATIGTTIALVYDSLTDVNGFLSNVVSAISAASFSISAWVQGNEYAQMIGYALSIDTLVDGAVSTFIFIVCTLTGFLVTALFGVFVSILPLLSDLAISALKHQMARSVSSVTS